jgi:hypothetical protein
MLVQSKHGRSVRRQEINTTTVRSRQNPTCSPRAPGGSLLPLSFGGAKATGFHIPRALPMVITMSHTEAGRLKVVWKARPKKGTITFGSEKAVEDQGGRIDARYPATDTIYEMK